MTKHATQQKYLGEKKNETASLSARVLVQITWNGCSSSPNMPTPFSMLPHTTLLLITSVYYSTYNIANQLLGGLSAKFYLERSFITPFKDNSCFMHQKVTSTRQKFHCGVPGTCYWSLT